MKPAQLPRAFQSLGALRNLNVAAVGLALAAATSSILGLILGDPTSHGQIGLLIGLPTLLCGVVWALVLRVRTTVGDSKLRWSWLGSIPLAAINGGLAAGMLLAYEPYAHDGVDVLERIKRFMLGFALGGSVGAIVWIPALVLTLIIFGIPLWRSHKLATQGLVGEERGERTIGVVSALAALAGLAISQMRFDTFLARSIGDPEIAHTTLAVLGRVAYWVFGVGGIGAGTLAAVFSSLRGGRRRAFVEEVAAGHVEGFRVAEAPEGKVLVRVTSMGEGYRVANFEEPVYEESMESEETRRAARIPR